jgi:hypothetical protein
MLTSQLSNIVVMLPSQLSNVVVMLIDSSFADFLGVAGSIPGLVV